MANQFSAGIAPGSGMDPGVFDAWAGLFPNRPATGTGAAGTPSPYNYGASPSPGGPGGITPGAVGLPQPYRDLENVYPNLSGANAALSQNILGQLQGQLSTETVNNIQDAMARFGVSSGMPGSGLARNRFGRDIGLSTQQLQQQGLQNYNATIPTISNTQTVNPAVQAQIARGNADAAVAGNQARSAQNLYRDQFNMANPQRPNVTGPIPAAMAPGGGGGGGGQAPRPNLSPFGSGGVIAPQYGTRNDGSGVTQNPLMSGGAWYAQPAIPSYSPDPYNFFGGGGGGGGGGSPFVPDYGAPSYDSPYDFFGNYGGGGGGGGSPLVPDYGAAANDAPYNFFQDYGGGGGGDYAANDYWSDYGGSGGGWEW